MIYPSIDPVALDFGFLQIHWYGLMYVLAFVLAFLLAHLRRRAHYLTRKNIDDLMIYGALGVIIGGRLGYILFYHFSTIWSQPVFIFQIWRGGMSFHGGLLGVIFALWIFARKHHFRFWKITDFVAPLVPLGLGFGRIGNFINGELWGKITESPLGVYAPDYQGVWAFRHPSQLYEAFLEGLILFIILWIFSHKPRPLGSVSAVFLIAYGTFRFLVEFVRSPDFHIGYLAFEWLTMGQALSAPMIVLGFYLLFKMRRIKQ